MPSAEVRLLAPDREEVKSAAGRFFASGLCCAVEVERVHASAAWEPRLLLFPSAAPASAIGAVEDTVASVAGSRVRMVGYDPALLSPVRLPAAVICSPPEQV